MNNIYQFLHTVLYAGETFARQYWLYCTLIGCFLPDCTTAQVSMSSFRRLKKYEGSIIKSRSSTNLPLPDSTLTLSPTLSDSSLSEIVVTSALIRRPYINYSSDLITSRAFTRLVKRDITFATLGSQSPTPGLTLDPEAGDRTAYISAFLVREIEYPIVRWQEAEQLGYEILPNKYFYRYEEPTPSDQLIDEFWHLEEQAEAILNQIRTPETV